MCKEVIAALILSVAVEVGVPPYFALAVAVTESELNPMAISKENQNGTRDHGIMQLNDKYFGHLGDSLYCAETNIRAGVGLIKTLMEMPDIYTFFAVALTYNAGYSRLNNPPASTVSYARRVMLKYEELATDSFQFLVPGKR